MLPKITQGVTTVIVGNCGISASPVALKGDPPDPMNLLGERDAFQYPTFAGLREGGERGASGGECRRFDRAHGAAQQPDGPARIARPRRRDRRHARATRRGARNGALGLEFGLAYGSAFAAPTQEVMALAEPLAAAGALHHAHAHRVRRSSTRWTRRIASAVMRACR